MCKRIKNLLFKLVDFCNTKEQKRLIIETAVNDIKKFNQAEKIISMEDKLRKGVEDLQRNKEWYEGNLNEILYLYSINEYDKLEIKLQQLVHVLNNK